MKKVFKVIAIIISILILVPLIVIFGPWIFLAITFVVTPGDIIFTEHPNCIPESVLTSTPESRIYQLSSAYSQDYSSLKIGSREHYISLNSPSSREEASTLLPEGTKLHLDGYAVFQEPTGNQKGFSSELHTFRGSIGEDTVWISDFQLDDFQWETYDLRHEANEASLISIGFIETKLGDRSYLDMPSDWNCPQ